MKMTIDIQNMNEKKYVSFEEVEEVTPFVLKDTLSMLPENKAFMVLSEWITHFVMNQKLIYRSVTEKDSFTQYKQSRIPMLFYFKFIYELRALGKESLISINTFLELINNKGFSLNQIAYDSKKNSFYFYFNVKNKLNVHALYVSRGSVMFSQYAGNINTVEKSIRYIKDLPNVNDVPVIVDMLKTDTGVGITEFLACRDYHYTGYQKYLPMELINNFNLDISDINKVVLDSELSLVPIDFDKLTITSTVTKNSLKNLVRLNKSIIKNHLVTEVTNPSTPYKTPLHTAVIEITSSTTGEYLDTLLIVNNNVMSLSQFNKSKYGDILSDETFYNRDELNREIKTTPHPIPAGYTGTITPVSPNKRYKGELVYDRVTNAIIYKIYNRAKITPLFNNKHLSIASLFTE